MHPSRLMRPAPSRLPTPAGGWIWCLDEGGKYDEQELLEYIQGLCQEYGQRFASQVSMSSYQTLPPEAVSISEPPERAWLDRLYEAGDE